MSFKDYSNWKSDNKRLDITEVEKYLNSFKMEIEKEYKEVYLNRMNYEDYLKLLLLKYKLKKESEGKFNVVVSIIALVFSLFVILLQSLVEFINNYFYSFFLLLFICIMITKILLDDFGFQLSKRKPTQLIIYYIEMELSKKS